MCLIGRADPRVVGYKPDYQNQAVEMIQDRRRSSSFLEPDELDLPGQNQQMLIEYQGCDRERTIGLDRRSAQVSVRSAPEIGRAHV